MLTKGDAPRVVLLCPPFLPVPAVRGGGRETLITSLIEENESCGLLDIEVLSPWDAEAEFAAAKYKKTRVEFLTSEGALDYRRLWWKPMRAVQRYVKRDLMLNSFYREAYSACRSKEFDLLIDEGGVHPDLRIFAQTFGRARVGAHLHCVYRPSSELSGIVGFTLSVSDFVRQAWNPGGLQKTDDYVVRNGVEIELFSEEHSEEDLQRLRTRFDLTKDDFIVLYCGRLAPEKGPLELARAILELDDINIKLLIVGGRDPNSDKAGRYYSLLKKIAEGSNGRICLTGPIENKKLGTIYQLCSLQVIPTLCEEAAGLVAVEGMAAGLPQIVTDSGGLPEYVDSSCSITVSRGDTLVFDLAQQVIALKKDAEALNRMKVNARRRGKLFTREQYYLDFVEAVIHQRKMSCARGGQSG